MPDTDPPRPAVFLDRDGTLIEEVNYLAHPDQVRLFAGAADAVRTLNARGVPVVVVTNQAGVARGYFPEARIAEVHARLDELLAAAGARVDGYYACPHHPDAADERYRVACGCRKPSPGLLRRAETELRLDLSRSCMIGDKESDLEAGARAGCRPILVRTGYGVGIDPATVPAEWGLLGVVDSLADAVELWLTHRPRPAAAAGEG
jgi:D-glycero-D-manno-heptose 1,7-bisphosphate phosphatase